MLQKNNATRTIPFIFLTSKSEKSDFRKGMELGADDYIAKPFDGTELLKAVEQRLKKAELFRKENDEGSNDVGKKSKSENGEELLQEFISGRNTGKFRRKEHIYTEGNRPFYLYYIIKGKIKTYKTYEDGRELVIGLYREGDFLGYIALLENSNYKETAETMEETEVAVIPKKDFESLINDNPQVGRTFIHMLAKNVAEKEQHLLGLAYHSLRKKVAETLTLLYEKYANRDTDNFTIDINRESLANMAGVAKESFIRTLSDFKNEKLIEIKGRAITILDKKKLQNLAN
ncbi:MAG: cyclic nucleotide-binding domain-containing protein, partial [Bacteroidota bacterium]